MRYEFENKDLIVLQGGLTFKEKLARLKNKIIKFTTSSSETPIPSIDVVAADYIVNLNSNSIKEGDLKVNSILGNEPSVFNLISDVSHGLLILNTDGTFTYTPTIDYFGTDSFEYSITDSQLKQDVGTVSFNIIENVLASDYEFIVDKNGFFASDLYSNSALGVQPSVFSLVDDLSNGDLNIYSDGFFEYVPNFDFTGQGSFTYKITDSLNNEDIGNVNLIIANIIDAVSFNLKVNKNELKEDDLNNYCEIGETPSNFYLVDNTLTGELNLNLDGTFSFNPETDFIGNDSFTYKIVDSLNRESIGTVSLSIQEKTYKLDLVLAIIQYTASTSVFAGTNFISFFKNTSTYEMELTLTNGKTWEDYILMIDTYYYTTTSYNINGISYSEDKTKLMYLYSGSSEKVANILFFEYVEVQ